VSLPLDPGDAVIVSCVVWALIGTVTGFVGSRLPDRRIDHDSWLTRIRAFEEDGRLYRRWLRLDHWRDRLPEAGGLFPGGVSKRHLGGTDDDHLRRFAMETRRAELVHWMNLSAGPFFIIWCGIPLGLCMLAFGIVAHTPFICIQRSNRARLERVLAGRARRDRSR
jgi:glycosyl-4,4'-diaponeurosporenoate acyltransferase